jgi:outer membrane biosynthesis protein TonB
MSITPTTPKDPLPSPTSRTAEVHDLYDAGNWESAYRHFDEDAVPQLLLHLQDDLTRARRREAAWLSVIVHLLVVILFVNQPRLEDLYRRVFLHQQPVMRVSMQDLMKKKELTYLELPPDLQKLTERPKTNIISDKDRVATSKTPQLDAKQLRKLISRPGAPGPHVPEGQPAPAPGTAAQNQPAPQGQPQEQQAQQQPQANQQQNQIAQLQPPTVDRKTPPVNFGRSMSAGSAIEQAARGAVQNRGGASGDDGNFGPNIARNGAAAQSGLEILSDTMGVDFDPYLKRIVQVVREHWYSLMPESVFPPISKSGGVAIEFAIMKNGSVAGMALAGTSGDTALERASWGSITSSNPFPPLPNEFPGQYIKLRFIYCYNDACNNPQSNVH